MAEGCNPATPIVMRHEGSVMDALRTTVGHAAKLTVDEPADGKRPPRFRDWRPSDGQDPKTSRRRDAPTPLGLPKRFGRGGNDPIGDDPPALPVRGGGLRSGIAPSRCLGTPLPSRGVLQRILRGSNGFAAILMRHLPRWPLAILTRYGTNEA
jgi:hypothetical protein